MTDRTDLPDDLTAVVDEIEAEARRIRESGEYPATLERELDALFEDLVPERLDEHDFEAVLDRAERASLIDLHAPIDDERRVYVHVKRGVQKLVLWYMDYVVRQLATFAANTTRAVRLLGSRVEGVEESQDAIMRRLPDLGLDLDGDLAVLGPDPSARWGEAVTVALAGVVGRVLHAEAGEGRLVEALVEQGIDAYGVDPRVVDESLTLRRGAVLDHLDVVGAGALEGLVLSGVTDRLPRDSKVALAEAATRVLSSGGRLVLVSVDPSMWAEVAPSPLVELGAGRPLSPDTWRFLLERRGFDEIGVATDGPGYMVTARRSD